jgi:subtilisin family serine protease
MYSLRYGGKTGKKISLALSDDLVVTRTRESRSLESAVSTRDSLEALDHSQVIASFPDAGVDVHRVTAPKAVKASRDAVRKALKAEPGLRFAGRALVDPKSKRPVIYTENLFVKFRDDAAVSKCRGLLKSLGLTARRELGFAPNAFFVSAPEDTGLEIFAIANALLQEDLVELCHPELIREVRRRGAFPQQWHLKKATIGGQVVDQHANVEAAWELSEGQGVIIAVIDDGVDLDHEEFTGAGKIASPRDVTRGTDNPRPGLRDHHGTACAGVACANGLQGASGVAPKARLMPIRLTSGLGSQAEADAFVWAADHGASVISCSWGPLDGAWWDPDDPLHNQVVPLPDGTRLAIDYAITNGRGGKGCVICWAAGNGNESVDNDGYASYGKVISVAACSDRGQRSAYSDFGQANWCCFPSNNFGPPAPLTPGIWTTDRTGRAGYNTRPSPDGDYVDSFGGTSSACPGAAGIAALVLARNPELRWDEVKENLKQSCDRIDADGGEYDANGHSPKYGFGRLNGRRAVELAIPSTSAYTAIHTAIQTVEIKDLQTSSLSAHVGDDAAMKSVKVSVVIEHTYIGDLVVEIVPPSVTGVGSIVLHNREGGSARNISRTYDPLNTNALAQLLGKSPQGAWTLRVHDKARHDVGKIERFSVELEL